MDADRLEREPGGRGAANTPSGKSLRDPKTTSSLAARTGSSANSEGDDLSLVRRTQQGERSAFDTLVTRYQRRIIKVTMRYTRDLCDAEDAAQEAFISAYRGIGHFRCECAFYTWLYRIAINSARNVRTARARDPSADADQLLGDVMDGVPALQEKDTPENLALTEEIRQSVRTSLSMLPDVLRVALMLREIEGMAYDEIALSTNCPIGTVRSRIYRARELVDRRLRRVYPGGLGRLDHNPEADADSDLRRLARKSR